MSLDKVNYARFQNASIFAAYLLVQKERLRKYNQDFSVNVDALEKFISKKDVRIQDVQNKPS